MARPLTLALTPALTLALTLTLTLTLTLILTQVRALHGQTVVRIDKLAAEALKVLDRDAMVSVAAEAHTHGYTTADLIDIDQVRGASVVCPSAAEVEAGVAASPGCRQAWQQSSVRLL